MQELMQDRYKFKIYDKTEKKFLPLDSKTENTDSWISIDNTGVYLVERDNARDVAFFTDITEDVIILQCTGLKDKNGKLIYEADIVRFKDNITINGSKAHIAVIEHNEAFNAFMYHAECMGLYTVNKAQNEKFNVEVIGNIYENPELLEVTNKIKENK